MNILVTGAKGFIGKSLVCALKNIKDGKDTTHAALSVSNVSEYDLDTDPALLDVFCAEADFVFHLAGVNRPRSESEFETVNIGLTDRLLSTLRSHGNFCPVMLASSVQAALDCEYGNSKRKAEEHFFAYAKQSGAKVLVYRFPNVFGKWCRPNYNSAVATFCHNTANGLPVNVHEPDRVQELLYIDDLVEEMLSALCGDEHRLPPNKNGNRYCTVPCTYRVSLGETARLLATFNKRSVPITIPPFARGSFEAKLYSAYLSYLPKERTALALATKCDSRGSFTEIFRPDGGGQLSVNTTKPGETKGQHWHNTKWEIFVVISGQGVIKQRRIGCDDVWETAVSGEEAKAVYILPGYTHSIENTSATVDLVTLIWASEPFDREHPDTFSEPI